MATQKIQIQIPTPCHENWEQMTTVEKGRFCNACQKTVFDFTKLSDRQIFEAFQKNKNLCGRFAVHQLNRELVIPAEKKQRWFPYLTATIFTSLLSLCKSHAQVEPKVKTEQTDTVSTLKNKLIKTSGDIKPLKGIVLDAEGSPLPEATVEIKGTYQSTITYLDGVFHIKATISDTLVINLSGYTTKEIAVQEYNYTPIILEAEIIELDEVVLIGYKSTTIVTGTGTATISFINEVPKNYSTNSIKPKTNQERKNRSLRIRLFRN